MLNNNIGRLVKSVSFQLCLDGMADVCGALERIHVCFNCIMRVLWRDTQPQSPPQSQGCLLIETCLHNLIFYLLISLTEAASCHSSQARINGNIVPVGEGPGRGRGLNDRAPVFWQLDKKPTVNEPNHRAFDMQEPHYIYWTSAALQQS